MLPIDDETRVVWTHGPVSCVSRTVDDGRIEVSVVGDEGTLERYVFPDVESASAYAIEKLRAYSAPIR